MRYRDIISMNENATAGATASSAVAAVVQPLGAEPAKPKKKAKKPPVVIKR